MHIIRIDTWERAHPEQVLKYRIWPESEVNWQQELASFCSGCHRPQPDRRPLIGDGAPQVGAARRASRRARLIALRPSVPHPAQENQPASSMKDGGEKCSDAGEEAAFLLLLVCDLSLTLRL